MYDTRNRTQRRLKSQPSESLYACLVQGKFTVVTDHIIFRPCMLQYSHTKRGSHSRKKSMRMSSRVDAVQAIYNEAATLMEAKLKAPQ